MNSDSFIHKELSRIYPEYNAIKDPDLQLEFFNTLPTVTQRALKAASIRSKGIGPNKILINDSEIDMKSLYTLVETYQSSNITDQPTLATLVSMYVAYYPVDYNDDGSIECARSVLDTQLILAYRSWWRDIHSSVYVTLPGRTMEIVGFLSTDCSDDDLCVFEVVDLYYLLLRRGESHAKQLFKTRFPLTHEIQSSETYSIDASIRSNEPIQTYVTNVPLFADLNTKKHIDMNSLRDQFIQLRKKFRLWLLTNLHNYIFTLLSNHCTTDIYHSNIHIPDIIILDEPFLPQELSDEDMNSPEENKNRLIVLKDRAAATKVLLYTPCISILQNNQINDDLDALQALQAHVMAYTDKEFEMLCKDSIPLFPNGWA